MEKLYVHARRTEAGEIIAVDWQWWANKERPAVAGVLSVPVSDFHTADRTALAELKALFHLLENRQVHGPGRLGNGFKVIVSHSSIRKAVAKSALKKTMVAKTEKKAIAIAANFLATKYFEVTVEVNSLPDVEPKRFEPQEQLDCVGLQFDRVGIDCPLLGEHVFVTRHAMHRYVARIDQKRDKFNEADLTGVADERWSQAWRWFVRILPHKDLEKATLLPAAQRNAEKKYGKNCYYLHFEAANALLILRRNSVGLALVTVIRLSPLVPIIDRADYMVGQRLVKAHVHLQRK